MPTRANLRRLESDLESKCRLAQAVRPWVQYARFVLLQDAGDQALLGRSGWFFYRPAVQYLVEPCPLPVRSVPVRASKERVAGISPAEEEAKMAATQTPDGVTTSEVFAAIVSFRDDLAKRGIKLLVMPAPNKSSIYPEMLTARANGTCSTPALGGERDRGESRLGPEPSRGRLGYINPVTREVLAIAEASRRRGH